MWYYLDRTNQQQGPVEDGQLPVLLSQGVIVPQSLVWRDGMANWLPLQQVLPMQSVAVPTLAPAVCQICHKPVGADNLIELAGVRVCAECKPVAIQTLSEGGQIGTAIIWRDGKKIVCKDGAKFPRRCVKCNLPANDPPLKRKLYWHNPLYYLLLLVPYVRLFVYIAVAIFVRKRAAVEIYLCERHKQQRIYLIAGVIIAFIAMVAGIAWGIAASSGLIAFLGGLCIVGAFVMGIFARTVRTVKIKDKTVWLKGACKDFMDQLPGWDG